MNNNHVKFVLSAFVIPVVLAACGGAPVREVEIEKPQFKVTDAAPGGREAWLDSPNFYAKKEGLDTDNYYYYVGDAQSADKRMAVLRLSATRFGGLSGGTSHASNPPSATLLGHLGPISRDMPRASQRRSCQPPSARRVARYNC